MRKLARLALGGAIALAAAGSAVAAAPDKKVMEVPLPDGSTARIEYYGEIAPKVTIEPRKAWAFPGDWMTGRFGPMMNIDRIFEQMERQRDALLKQMRRMPRHGGGPGTIPKVASYGAAPAGTTSISVVSVSNGGGTCTRTTRMISQGDGKPPKVETQVSGNCAASEAPAQPLERS